MRCEKEKGKKEKEIHGKQKGTLDRCVPWPTYFISSYLTCSKNKTDLFFFQFPIAKPIIMTEKVGGSHYRTIISESYHLMYVVTSSIHTYLMYTLPTPKLSLSLPPLSESKKKKKSL